jgi:hypothetical protein
MARDRSRQSAEFRKLTERGLELPAATSTTATAGTWRFNRRDVAV